MKDVLNNNLFLIDELADKGLTRSDLADMVGMCRKSMYNKLQERNTFTGQELAKLKDVTGLNFYYTSNGRLQIV